MCLPEAPDDIVCRYVTHAFACGYKQGSVSAFVSSRPRPSTPLLVTPDQREDLSRYYPRVTQMKKAQPTKSIKPCIYWSG